MTEDRQVKTRKPVPQFNPKNKEQGSYNPNKKKRWKKRKPHKKDLGKSIKDLQDFFNKNYHAP
jgi:hypothetical protein